MKRSRPRQHKRRLPTGRTITINRGRRKSVKRSRFQTTKGTFRKMTDPTGRSDKKSKFFGCERSMMNQGYNPESARLICASIARRKRGNYGSSVFRGVDDFELKLLELQNELQPRSKSRDEPKIIYVTPSRKIAEKFGKHVLEIEREGLDLKKQPGKARLLFTEKSIGRSKIKMLEE